MHKIVVGLGWGDCSKGSVVDALTRYDKSTYNIRVSGGANASHRVVLPNGHVHQFHTFGSGTFAGAKTLLSRHTLIDPIMIRKERNELAEHLFSDPYRRLSIDENALVVTPYHVALNRLRSPKGTTCGLGIGECTSDSINRPEAAIRASDLRDSETLIGKLIMLRAALCELVPDWSITNDPNLQIMETQGVDIGDQLCKISERLNILSGDQVLDIISQERCTFELSQGCLLDQDFGFHPYTTWASTTPKNALELCSDANVEAKVIGVTRTYMTRHGAGPFPTYSTQLTNEMSDPGNPENEWQGKMRFGGLDIPLLQYAIRACGQMDALAITHVDTLDQRDVWDICVDHPGIDLSLPTSLQEQESLCNALFDPLCEHPPRVKSLYSDLVLEFIEDRLALPIALTSHGPTHNDKVIGPFLSGT